ncbi:transmembrane protein 50A-like [Acropora muricata]|uniref:transmembrane protein 50A-like n=1 Tax=Acropora muricata TaxID=159855 RepID=UPI0010FC9579|nr:transmembrane protein 50A-like isoform X1 [Acropora millepora]
MSGCFDDTYCPDMEMISERRNIIASVSAGALFSIGWWILIDAASTTHPPFEPAYHTPGVITSFAVFMVNAVSNAHIRGDTYSTGCIGQTGARVWLIMGFLLLFGGLIAATWILFGAYVVPADPQPWPGVAIFLQNAFIFFSAIVFKFGRSEENY